MAERDDAPGQPTADEPKPLAVCRGGLLERVPSAALLARLDRMLANLQAYVDQRAFEKAVRALGEAPG